MFDDKGLRTVDNAEDRAVKDEAWSYQTPCIFNIDDHEVEIYLIIRYMLKGEQRPQTERHLAGRLHKQPLRR
jgi:hypothetical protein